jgi:putative nucleotidyltransferase with HDIG domain
VGSFLALECVLAVVLFLTQAPHLDGPIVVLMLLLGLEVLAEIYPIEIYGDTYISIGDAIMAATIILFGVPGIVLLGPVAAIVSAVSARKVSLWLPQNAAMFTIVYAAGAAVYTALAPVRPDEFEIVMLPAIILATMTSFALSAVLLASFGKLYRHEPISEFWSKNGWIVPYYFGLSLIGLALGVSYLALGIAGVLAFVAPALLIRVAMKQYVDKTEENVQKLKTQNTELQTANVEIRRISDELRVSYDGTLEALVNALDARDQETKGHSLRVQRYMMDIAREFGVPEDTKEWIDMQRGSLLHDVGKIGVSDTILLKPGKLSDEEWESMRKHPEIGYNMLRQVRFLEGAAEIILAHHERWDGKGYPKGLHEDEIPLGARIFMVCDTFDSMTSDRPYRKALSTEVALNEILKYNGSQFDPRVVEAFLDIYETWVREREELHAAGIELRAA